MKKAGIILFTLVLCAGTVFSFAYTASPKEKIDSDIIARAASLDDIKNALRKTGRFDNSNSSQKKYGALAGGGDMSKAPSAMLEAMEDFAQASGNAMDASAAFDEETGAAANAGYSETNVQIEGIDEADIVKTDGEYLYIAADKCVYIVSVDKDKMGVATKLEEEFFIRNIFIDEDRLVVFGSHTMEEKAPVLYDKNEDLEIVNESETADLSMPVYAAMKTDANFTVDPAFGWYECKTFTDVNIYDTANKEKPELLQEFSLEGDFVTARKSGEIVYLAASKYIYGINDLEKASGSDILPLYSDTRAKLDGKDTFNFGGEEMIVAEPSCVYICSIKESTAFTTLAVLNIAGDEEADIKSYMGSVRDFYMNKDSIFLTFDNYEYDEKTGTGREYTDIIALDVDGKKVTYRADGTVGGSLLNQFSMDEYGGYLRVATTEWEWGSGEQSSSLFVLDKNLNIVGSIKDIATGEQIYSVRFMGDKGYIVTFETMDPFFTVDLSDPENPKIAGELKLPGYSNYLHQIDENTVLGVGRQTKELITRDEFGNEEVVGFREGGIKLSLFDISDFTDPKELDSYILGGDSTWSDALYDHKAIMVNRDKNFIGICASSYESGKDTNGAYIFDISGENISLEGSIENTNVNNYMIDEGDENAFYFSRLCYVGDTYYYLDNGTVYAIQMTDGSFGTTAQLRL